MTIKELQDKIYESRELNDKFETAHDIGMEHNVAFTEWLDEIEKDRVKMCLREWTC